MGIKTNSDSDLVSVLKNDGVEHSELVKYENCSTINLQELRDDLGMGSWAVRIAYNELFGGVVIQQQPGEGNRKHFHPDADENWVILDGEWEWWIEGIGTQRVKQHDIIVLVKARELDMLLQDRM
jgi:oxalate decarboxylase/phosphoglucose isomerase-like protein (cupin superfamily)